MNNIRCRFAPSPTGFLHIGGARTALFNYLFAKNNNGKFLVRIEDTDKKRSTEEAKKAIFSGLSWLGLEADEKITIQSKNEERHKEIVEKLIKENKAYYCYMTPEELKQEREKNPHWKYDNRWRDSSKTPPNGITPVVRIKSPTEGELIIDDLVQGKVAVTSGEIEDFIIARADKTPTYMLAVVVDDIDMQISHIIRGDDHLTNSFKQLVIYNALEQKPAYFAHIPLIHGSDGAKLSKRHGALGVDSYKQMGYLKEAVNNYLMKLGWSYGDKDIITLDEAIKNFNIKKLIKSAARFDFDKLNHINQYYIKNYDKSKLYDLLVDFYAETPNNQEKSRIISALDELSERAKTLKELAEISHFYLDKKPEIENPEKITEAKQYINFFTKEIEKLEIFKEDNIKQIIKQTTEKFDIKMGKIGPAIRILITGSTKSAGNITTIIERLGKEKSLERLNYE